MSLEDLSLEQRDELAMLARQLADNPATRKQFLRMTKQVKPEMSIPELDMEDFTNTKVSAAEERVMGLEAKLREREAREELEKRRARLNRPTQEVEQIEKLMLDKGMTNHETAAEYFDWMRQAAEPTPNSAMGYTPSALSKFDLSKYWKNPQMGARDEAAQALKDLRKNTRPIGI